MEHRCVGGEGEILRVAGNEKLERHLHEFFAGQLRARETVEHSLPMLGKLLGHTQAATTARYAHLADSPVIAAAELIDAAFAAMTAKSDD